MHVNDEEVDCTYNGLNAEARVALLRPYRDLGWRVTVYQHTWEKGIASYYAGTVKRRTYHMRDRVSAVNKFAKLSAAMVAVFCEGAR